MSNKSVFRYAFLLGFASLAATPADDFRISGPYTHDNLTIFLIHGSGNGSGRKLLTLQEAMDQKKVVVYETGSVNELSIENLSSEDVYIQAGDIVKGGQQDRVFPDDFILTPKSGKLPIASFCVEHGRWSKRGGEDASEFGGSSQAVAGKSLKMAVRNQRDQSQVWAEVAKTQQSLAIASNLSVGAGGRPAALAPASPTSMQLALENKKVVEATDAYIQKLSKIVEGKKDVVGVAFAINGKVDSADVYSSTDLFQRLWPKLLKASAVEALAERSKMKTSPLVDPSAVRRAMAEAERGRETSKEVAGRLLVVKKESDAVLLFEARGTNAGAGWIHKSYIVK